MAEDLESRARYVRLGGPKFLPDLIIGYGSFVHGMIQLGKNVRVGDGTFIKSEDGTITIGDNTTIGDHVLIKGKVAIGSGNYIGDRSDLRNGTTIGNGNKFYACTIGAEAQIRAEKVVEDEMILTIGNHNVFREYAVVSRGSIKGTGKTTIGNRNMVYSHAHIAHDCVIGDYNEFVSYAGLAGHVCVGNHARISGKAGVAQFSKIGDYSFIDGGSAVSGIVLPYSRVGGNPALFKGINFVRLARLYPPEEARKILRELRKAYDLIKNPKISDADLALRLKELGSMPANEIAEFILASDGRGKILRYRLGVSSDAKNESGD